MANPSHLKTLKKGVKNWNNWRKRYPKVYPDLSEANLEGADLSGADFREADIGGANLTGTNLHSATMRSAFLAAVDFTYAVLSEADLYEAFLVYAVFNECKLDGANLTKATMDDTKLCNVDLSSTSGLETVDHAGPSTIGIDTLYKSKGQIPESFLRGCGIPDKMIEFAQSIARNPVELNSCFISHSTKDHEFAESLYQDLQTAGVRCWFAPHDVKGGRKLHEQIEQAIRTHDRLLLVLSPTSINSEWVKREIDKARKKEAEENRDVLFPISLVKYKELEKWEHIDPSTGKDVAQEIRSFYIPDFSNWKDHDSYQAAFKRLLKDLKGERGRKESPE